MKDNPDNIYLVGLMGAGKTTIGRSLARRLDRRFVDTDHEIEARAGVRVPVIFEVEGEAGFRKREHQMLEELTQAHGLVLATGGGIVMNPDNRRLLAGNGLVIYLHARPELLWQRTRHDRNRPLLQVADPLARLRELYALRDPLYREIADVVIDGEGMAVTAVVRMIEKRIEETCKV